MQFVQYHFVLVASLFLAIWGIWKAASRWNTFYIGWSVHSPSLEFQLFAGRNFPQPWLEWQTIFCNISTWQASRGTPGQWVLWSGDHISGWFRLFEQNFETATLGKEGQPLCYLQSFWCRKLKVAEFLNACWVEGNPVAPHRLDVLGRQIKMSIVSNQAPYRSLSGSRLDAHKIPWPWPIRHGQCHLHLDFSSLESRFHKEEFGLVLGSIETALQNIPDQGQVWQLQYKHHVYEQTRYQTQRQGCSYQSTCQTIAGDLVSVAQPTAADAQDDFDLPEVKLSDWRHVGGQFCKFEFQFLGFVWFFQTMFVASPL